MKKLWFILSLLVTTGCFIQASVRARGLFRSSIVYQLNRSQFDANNSNNCVNMSGYQSSLFQRKLAALGVYPDLFKTEVYSFEQFMDFGPKFFTNEKSMALELSLEVLQEHGTFVRVDAPPDQNRHIYFYGTLQVPLAAIIRVFVFRGGYWCPLRLQVKEGVGMADSLIQKKGALWGPYMCLCPISIIFDELDS